MKNQDEFTIPTLERFVLLIAGFTNFIMGFAIYFILRNDKGKQEYAEFIQRGSVFGLCFTIIGLIFALVKYLI